MDEFIKKVIWKVLVLTLIVIIGLSARWYTLFSLPMIHLFKEPLFFSDLLNKPIILPYFISLFFAVSNLLLIWYIGRLKISNEAGVLAAFLYAISPWTVYTDVSGSIFTFLLFCILVLYTGWNKITSLIAVLVLIYSSILTWPIVAGFIFKDRRKIFFSSLVILLIPLIFIAKGNAAGFKNIVSNQVSIFSNVGILNAVNVFRGETLNTNFGFISKIVENRYTYFGENLVFNYTNHFVPITYFTPQYRLLEFSYNPPIFLGFIIPFFIGLYSLFKDGKISLLAPTLFLIIPSVISRVSPSFERLILVAPFIFLVIAVGIIQMVKSKRLIIQMVLIGITALIALQTVIIILDISIRENIRLTEFLKLK